MDELQTSVQLSLSTNTSTLTNMSQLPVDSELWSVVEQRTQEILSAIQPAVASENKRKSIIKFVKDLIEEHFGAEVLAFGSVPLKTYLPDGDIDLTVLIHPNMEENFARDICRILKCKEDHGFQVKNIQYIQAQVKVVKCCMKNISVDISFNQMAGLCTLDFLEQFDRFIGKDHLLKRSIIMVKAWCFYESRILGAHHGLISTYALEILVLCIINLFHASLPGPLAVLYRFLDYYNKFDWESYGVSICGPVPISSLPKLTANWIESTKENGLLFGKEFLRKNRWASSAPLRHAENETFEFPIKHLNVVDPLKDGNNLGRSVSRGNFHRIKCALYFGAQQLAEILKLPGESMVAGLENFFKNTLERNGRGVRPDAQVPVPAFGSGRSVPFNLCAEYSSHVDHMQDLLLPPHPPTKHWPVLPSSQPSSVGDAVPLLSYSNEICFPRSSPVEFSPPVQTSRGVLVPGVQNSTGLIPRSRGTGTYIPVVTARSFRDYRPWSTRTIFPRSQRQWSRPQRIGRIYFPPEELGEQESGHTFCIDEPENQVARETIKSKADEETSGEGNSLDLSVEQFPHLPSINKTISLEPHKTYEPICNANESKDTVPVESLGFGTFGRSPLPLVLHPTTKGNLADTTASTNEQQTVDDVQEEFQLRDEEFPPLFL